MFAGTRLSRVYVATRVVLIGPPTAADVTRSWLAPKIEAARQNSGLGDRRPSSGNFVCDAVCVEQAMNRHFRTHGRRGAGPLSESATREPWGDPLNEYPRHGRRWADMRRGGRAGSPGLIDQVDDI